MLIAIDIGNSHVTFGVFNEDSPEPVHTGNLQTDRRITNDELAIRYSNLRKLWGLPDQRPEPVVIASVVPQLNYEFEHMFSKYFKTEPRFVENSMIPLELHYDYPAEIGADRVVNAYAAHVLFPSENLIIVDFGTATTIDLVSAGGAYEGGLIMAGIQTGLRSLVERTSKLPHIDLSVPSKLVGKNTPDGIRGGFIQGTGAMIDELSRRIVRELGWDKARVIATGGLSKLVKDASETIQLIDKDLTLKGLYYLWKNGHV